MTTNETPMCKCGRPAIAPIHDDPRRPFGHDVESAEPLD